MAKPNSKTPVQKSQPTKHKATKAGGAKGLKPAGQKVLDVVAGFLSIGKTEAPRKQVFTMTQMGKSTFANALTTLKTGYLIVKPDTLTLTELGQEHADPDALKGSGGLAMTNEDHQNHIKEHFKLKAKARELMDALKDGKVHNKKETAESIGMKMNSTFSNLMTDLKKKSIIVFDKTTIQLTDDMFPFGGRPE